MFHQQQQKPAFKFVIRSKIEEEKPTQDTTESNAGNHDAEETTKQTFKNESTEEQLTSIKTSTNTPITTTTTAVPTVAVTESVSNKDEQTLAKSALTNSEDRKRKRSDKDLPGSSAPLTSKKIHSHLERWNKKKEELKQEREIEEQAIKNYADLTAMACLLCQRKFKSRADLERHQELSDLHKTNLNDPVAVNRAKLKLQFLKTEAEEKESAQQYRNRAAERRQAYGQPEKPALSPPRPGGYKQPVVPREIEAIQQASMHVPISDTNKGAQMLQKMGWKKGEGLGKNGTGIVAPIKAESYAQQVASPQPPAKR